MKTTTPIKTIRNIKIFGLNGKFRIVKNIPVLKIGNKEMVDIDDIIKAEQTAIAEENSL